MDREPPRYLRRLLLLSAVSTIFFMTGGCSSLMVTALWVIKGNNVSAEWDGLEEMTVAVVCRPPQSLQPSVSFAASELATELGRRLASEGVDIEVIGQREVAEWTDENTWDEYTEIGEALDVDMVVGIEMNRFRLYGSQTIFRGTAEVDIQVFDIRDGGREVWSKSLPRTIWPPVAGGIPVSDKTEREFRREFVNHLANQIGKHFYPHDKTADFAIDSTTLR